MNIFAHQGPPAALVALRPSGAVVAEAMFFLQFCLIFLPRSLSSESETILHSRLLRPFVHFPVLILILNNKHKTVFASKLGDVQGALLDQRLRGPRCFPRIVCVGGHRHNNHGNVLNSCSLSLFSNKESEGREAAVDLEKDKNCTAVEIFHTEKQTVCQHFPTKHLLTYLFPEHL